MICSYFFTIQQRLQHLKLRRLLHTLPLYFNTFILHPLPLNRATPNLVVVMQGSQTHILWIVLLKTLTIVEQL